MKINIEYIEEILRHLYNHIISNANIKDEILYKKAIVYLDLTNSREANNLIIQNCINGNAKELDYLILAYIDLLEGKFIDAIKRMKYLEHTYSYEMFYTKILGDIYFSVSNFEEALKSYKKFVVYGDYCEDVHIHLANIYMDLGEWKKSLHLFSKIPESSLTDEIKTSIEVCNNIPINQVTSINAIYICSGLGLIDKIQISSLNFDSSIYCTGNVDDSIKESALVALSYVRNRNNKIKLSNIDNRGFHIHLPKFYTFKIGPSAGLAIAMGLYIHIGGLKSKSNWAYTGEIDIQGEVYPVGGIIEKVKACYVNGINTVFIPKDNINELVLNELSSKCKVIPIKNVEEVIEYYEKYN